MDAGRPSREARRQAGCPSARSPAGRTCRNRRSRGSSLTPWSRGSTPSTGCSRACGGRSRRPSARDRSRPHPDPRTLRSRSPERAPARGHRDGRNLDRFRRARPPMSEAAFDPVSALRTLLDHGVRFVVIGGFAARSARFPDGHRRSSTSATRATTRTWNGSRRRSRSSGRRSAASTRRSRSSSTRRRLRPATTSRSGPRRATSTSSARRRGEGFDDLVPNATDEVVDGITVLVASIEDLIRMKRAAGRAEGSDRGRGGSPPCATSSNAGPGLDPQRRGALGTAR